ncbi:DNA gyrase inhibitor YacG [Rubripirellula amarantea]|nr:DNA gyrase inhibitor YacG [Rubripirellula amarantea]MDA8744078.1 DNA gyrase inhibitor YacG [Rubripirellula amarantea]
MSVPNPRTMICSGCGKKFRIDQTLTPPFCSEQCQMADLNRWLSEEISVPHEGGNPGQSPKEIRFDDDDDEDE